MVTQELGGRAHQQEREDDAPDKDPFGDLELHVDRAVIAALALNGVCPLPVSAFTHHDDKCPPTWSDRIIVVAVKTSSP